MRNPRFWKRRWFRWRPTPELLQAYSGLFAVAPQHMLSETEVREELDRLEVLLIKESELATAVRGYLLTNHEDGLAPDYQREGGKRMLAERMADLRAGCPGETVYLSRHDWKFVRGSDPDSLPQAGEPA